MQLFKPTIRNLIWTRRCIFKAIIRNCQTLLLVNGPYPKSHSSRGLKFERFPSGLPTLSAYISVNRTTGLSYEHVFCQSIQYSDSSYSGGIHLHLSITTPRLLHLNALWPSNTTIDPIQAFNSKILYKLVLTPLKNGKLIT